MERFRPLPVTYAVYTRKSYKRRPYGDHIHRTVRDSRIAVRGTSARPLTAYFYCDCTSGWKHSLTVSLLLILVNVLPSSSSSAGVIVSICCRPLQVPVLVVTELSAPQNCPSNWQV